MAEEYEQGTVDYFLSKPITRMRFIIEKWLGSFTLLAIIYLMMITVALVMSFSLFGSQKYLFLLPEIVGSILFSTLVFLNIAFAIGEILRRSNLSFTISGFILIASIIISDVLVLVSQFTHNSSYEIISQYLPTWASTEFPFMLLQSSPFSTVVRELNIMPQTNSNVIFAIFSISIYSIISLVLSFVSFLKRDIPKKVS